MLRICYYVLYGAFYAGFVFHRSDSPALLWYSKAYIVFLAVAALPFLLPWVLGLASKKFGKRKLAFALVPSVLLLVGTWAVAHLYYDYTVVHPFDPYLQVHAQSLDEQYDRARKPDSFRILAMGGSTTANKRLPKDERYPTVLQRILAERYPDVVIEVLNAGQNWWATKNSLLNYVSYAEAWGPDLVVVMHGINDIGRSFSHPSFAIGDYNDAYTHFYGQARDAARAISFEGYLSRVPLRRVSSAWFSALRSTEADFPPEWYRSIKPFEHNLRRIVRYVRSDAADIMLVTQPHRYRNSMSPAEKSELYRHTMFIQKGEFPTTEVASTKSMAQAMDAFNAATRRVARSMDVILADAEPGIPKERRHFVDEVHYTSLGSHELARIVAERIVAAGVIEKLGGRAGADSP